MDATTHRRRTQFQIRRKSPGCRDRPAGQQLPSCPQGCGVLILHGVSRQRIPIRSVATLVLLLLTVPGCREQATTGGSTATQPSNSIAAASPKAAPEMAVAPTPQIQSSNPDPVLKEFEEYSGLILPVGAKTMTHGDGGIRDPKVAFYEWVIFSPTRLTPPDERRRGGKEILKLPLNESVQYLEGKIPGLKIEDPQEAFSTGWQAGQFEFSATWISAPAGDHIMVQRSRIRAN